MIAVLLSLLLTLRGSARSRAALQVEVLALRHQLHVLQRTRPRRFRLTKADRWLWVALSRHQRTVATTTQGLLELADWLTAQGCTHVAMDRSNIW